MGSFTTAVSVPTANDIWSWPTRTLSQTKFPFWSAIITQTQGSTSVASGATTTIDIKPPTGETWLIFLDFYLDSDSSLSYVAYYDFNGSTARLHTVSKTRGSYGISFPHLSVIKILTSDLYARLTVYNASGVSVNFYYGYNGFKLSKPLYTPKNVNELTTKAWKQTASKPLPEVLKPLEKYAVDILGANPLKPLEYETVIMLEENKTIAIDPVSEFPVETLNVYVQADILADLIAKFKTKTADPIKTGYEKYLNKWKDEGIELL